MASVSVWSCCKASENLQLSLISFFSANHWYKFILKSGVWLFSIFAWIVSKIVLNTFVLLLSSIIATLAQFESCLLHSFFSFQRLSNKYFSLSPINSHGSFKNVNEPLCNIVSTTYWFTFGLIVVNPGSASLSILMQPKLGIETDESKQGLSKSVK